MIKYIPGCSSFDFSNDTSISDTQREALEKIKKNVLCVFGSTGVQTALNTAVLDVLKYMAIFPGWLNKLEDTDGNVLPDCFLMPPGTTAIDFAYRLHTDLGNNFITAIDVKKKIAIGRNYPLQNTDVIEIVAGR